MPRQSRAKLVAPKTEPENHLPQTIEEFSLPELKEGPELSELDMEIECPRCHEFMELHSGFDKLMYSCENCSFLLKCV